jgi:hypothetical protein
MNTDFIENIIEIVGGSGGAAGQPRGIQALWGGHGRPGVRWNPSSLVFSILLYSGRPTVPFV